MNDRVKRFQDLLRFGRRTSGSPPLRPGRLHHRDLNWIGSARRFPGSSEVLLRFLQFFCRSFSTSTAKDPDPLVCVPNESSLHVNNGSICGNPFSWVVVAPHFFGQETGANVFREAHHRVHLCHWKRRNRRNRFSANCRNDPDAGPRAVPCRMIHPAPECPVGPVKDLVLWPLVGNSQI